MSVRLYKNVRVFPIYSRSNPNIKIAPRFSYSCIYVLVELFFRYGTFPTVFGPIRFLLVEVIQSKGHRPQDDIQALHKNMHLYFSYIFGPVIPRT